MRPLDWVVVAVALCSGLASFLLGRADDAHRATTVVVTSQGQPFGSWELPEGGTRRDTIPGPWGVTVLESDSSGVAVTEASCPHRLCRKAGKLRPAHGHRAIGGALVCAPNGIVVRLVSPDETELDETDVDGVTQ